MSNKQIPKNYLAKKILLAIIHWIIVVLILNF